MVWSNLVDCVAGLPTVVKLVDRETLMKEREEKKKVRRRSELENLKLLQNKSSREKYLEDQNQREVYYHCSGSTQYYTN